jgi:hypothetical protein
MHCEACKEELLELLYEEGLEPRRKLELMAHLADCRSCHEDYVGLLESRVMLQKWPDEETPWKLRVRPEYQNAPRSAVLQGRWSAVPAWKVFKGAIAALLFLTLALAASQSDVHWNSEGLTVQARLWRVSDVTVTPKAKPNELLEYVNHLIGKSEERQFQVLYKVWSEMESREKLAHDQLRTDVGITYRERESAPRPIGSGQ